MLNTGVADDAAFEDLEGAGFIALGGTLLAEVRARAEERDTPDVPNLEHVKHGVLMCPACDHWEMGTLERECPECLTRAEDAEASQ